MNRARVIIANSTLIKYRVGGGHWMVRLQWMLGLRQLGHDALLLELASTGCSNDDVAAFFAHLRRWGLDDAAVVVRCQDAATEDLRGAEYLGRGERETRQAIASADFLWNDCGMLRGPMLELFRRRVFIDLDPGHLQISALEWDLGVERHEAHLTVGTAVRDPGCGMPTLGVDWVPFLPPLHLNLWRSTDRPRLGAPVSSVTHWTWDELRLDGRRLSTSKREAYLRYLDLPGRLDVPLELAVHFHPEDRTGDPELLRLHGWRLVDPWADMADAEGYQRYIAGSLAELSCPKPVFRELRTGWFSDRSACYLASGRPVVAEDTGFSDHLPVGEGILTFTDVHEAAQRIQDVVERWDLHAAAARALAEEYFDGKRVLQQMIDASA